MATGTAVTKNFTDEQGGQWKAYWNGKKYAGDKVYVTVSGIGNSRQFKCDYANGTVNFGGAYGSMDRAKSALRALDIIE